jgi:hypothetical protein
MLSSENKTPAPISAAGLIGLQGGCLLCGRQNEAGRRDSRRPAKCDSIFGLSFDTSLFRTTARGKHTTGINNVNFYFCYFMPNKPLIYFQVLPLPSLALDALDGKEETVVHGVGVGTGVAGPKLS